MRLAALAFRIAVDVAAPAQATLVFNKSQAEIVTVPYAGGEPAVRVRHAFSPDWNR